MTPAERARYERYRQTDKYRESQLRYRTSEKWRRHQSIYGKYARDTTPALVGARKAVAIAVSHGMLSKPRACPECGRETRMEAHHHLGYELAHWFDVIWVCSTCHKALHPRA